MKAFIAYIFWSPCRRNTNPPYTYFNNMPIDSYNGNTLVAFLDISGFKELMKRNKEAVNALDKFYTTGYDVLKENTINDEIKIDGFFISDSGLIFVRLNEAESDLIGGMKKLLQIIQKINRNLLRHEIMLTTSIAYGQFLYQERLEFRGIEKNSIYGNAYVSAFLDNENGKPRIQPGQCRIVKRNLPEECGIDYLKGFETRLKENNKYIYFYWMVNNYEQISNFEHSYNSSYNKKFIGMVKSLNKYN